MLEFFEGCTASIYIPITSIHACILFLLLTSYFLCVCVFFFLLQTALLDAKDEGRLLRSQLERTLADLARAEDEAENARVSTKKVKMRYHD